MVFNKKAVFEDLLCKKCVMEEEVSIYVIMDYLDLIFLMWNVFGSFWDCVFMSFCLLAGGGCFVVNCMINYTEFVDGLLMETQS